MTASVFEKYAIKDGDVILSTTDKNFKVVCAGDMGDRKASCFTHAYKDRT